MGGRMADKQMHDLLCSKKCGCGKECYAHPDMPNTEHKCKDCLIRDNELIEDDVGFVQGLKSLVQDIGIILKYYLAKLFYNKEKSKKEE